MTVSPIVQDIIVFVFIMIACLSYLQNYLSTSIIDTKPTILFSIIYGLIIFGIFFIIQKFTMGQKSFTENFWFKVSPDRLGKCNKCIDDKTGFCECQNRPFEVPFADVNRLINN